MAKAQDGKVAVPRANMLEVPNFAVRVSILLLNWNNWKDTNECLASLQRLDYDNSKVIVLDNGSTDGSVDRIRERFPEVEVMELGDNLGFAKGNNAGIRVALECGAEYVWLLNNDTTVGRNALRALLQKAEEDPKIGAVGSAIYFMSEPQRLQVWGGGHVNWLGRAHQFVSPVSDDQVQFLTGASLFLRCSAVRSLGLLDEGFFMYWEDADYCFRLRRAGWRLAVASGSEVWHKGQASVGSGSALLDTYFSRSAARFFNRHALVPLIPLCISVALRLGKRMLTGNWKGVRAVWAGFRQPGVTP